MNNQGWIIGTEMPGQEKTFYCQSAFFPTYAIIAPNRQAASRRPFPDFETARKALVILILKNWQWQSSLYIGIEEAGE